MTDYLVVFNLYTALRRTKSGKTLCVGWRSLFWRVQEQAKVRRSGAQGKAERGNDDGHQPGV